jgi:hypothetical protein
VPPSLTAYLPRTPFHLYDWRIEASLRSLQVRGLGSAAKLGLNMTNDIASKTGDDLSHLNYTVLLPYNGTPNKPFRHNTYNG